MWDWRALAVTALSRAKLACLGLEVGMWECYIHGGAVFLLLEKVLLLEKLGSSSSK